jgi:Ca2+-transporting ATPase
MQLLWINIMSDIFPGLALSMEAPEPDVLDQQPRDPQDPLLSGKDYRRMLLESAVISSAALGAYGYGIARYGIGARAGTLAFHSLVAGQILHALSCRSEKKSLISAKTPPPNKYLTLAVGGSLVLQALTAIIPGLRSFLEITPIGLLDAAVVGGSALLSLAANETTKAPGR